MCGIFGYVGGRQAADVLIPGLESLSYRGYDSAGIAVLHEGRVNTLKRVGAPAQLLAEPPILGCAGVGHTRWATHGRPTEANAHPHTDCSGRFAVVHNGIFENASELRRSLEDAGHVFRSETDTEVLAHLLEASHVGNFMETLRSSLARTRGSYAVGVVAATDPDTVFVARNRSPLVLGVVDGGFVCASDVVALAPHTQQVAFLPDGAVCRLRVDGAVLVDASGKQRPLVFDILEGFFTVSAAKAGFEHHMLAEIFEMPSTAARFLRSSPIPAPLPMRTTLPLADTRRLRLVACGSSHHAGLVARRLMEELSGVPVDVRVASEERYETHVASDRDLGVYVSQSGETADTLEALRRSRKEGAESIAVVNAPWSSLAREASVCIAIEAGPEASVAATKSFTNTILALVRLGIEIGVARGKLGRADVQGLDRELQRVPDAIGQVLARSQDLRRMAETHLAGADHAFFLGRGAGHGLALEGALKLKEVGYVHAEGFCAGELKHGPLALIEPGTPTVAFACPGAARDVLLSNLSEVKARGGRILGIVPEGDPQARAVSDEAFAIPAIDPRLFPFPAAAASHLLAYYAARHRGCPIDRPRNLAKSVTVE